MMMMTHWPGLARVWDKDYDVCMTVLLERWCDD